MNNIIKTLAVLFLLFGSVISAYSKDTDSGKTLMQSISRTEVDTIKGYYFNPHPFNPFCPSTFLHFYIPDAKKVKITLKDTLKASEYTIVDSELQKGFYVVHWDASKLSSGWYVCEFATDDFRKSEKYALVR